MSRRTDTAELSANQPRPKPPKGKPFAKGQSGNPGGISKEKRAFLERLNAEDANEVYDSFIALVKAKNPTAVIKAVEYLAGKPPAAKEDNDALREGLTVVVQSLADSKGRKP